MHFQGSPISNFVLFLLPLQNHHFICNYLFFVRLKTKFSIAKIMSVYLPVNISAPSNQFALAATVFHDAWLLMSNLAPVSTAMPS